MRHTDTHTGTPEVFIQCLGCYNAGQITGYWDDATQAAIAWEDIQGRDDHICGNPEEYMIADVEGFDGLDISEYEDLDQVEALAEAIEEHGPALAGWIAIDKEYRLNTEDIEDTIMTFRDRYIGTYDTVKEFAENNVELIMTAVYGRHVEPLPDDYYNLIDIQAVIRNMEYCGHFETVKVYSNEYTYQVHIFEVR